MIHVVFDTNTLVSAAFWDDSPPARAFNLFEARRDLQMFVSDAILTETRRILASPEMNRYVAATADCVVFIDEFVGRLHRLATEVTVTTTLTVITEDPSDNAILATAVDAGAHYLVTGDKHLLRLGTWRGIKIVNTATFLAEVSAVS